MNALPKIVQIATISDSSSHHPMIIALDEAGDVWQLILDRKDRKWFKTTLEIEQEAE